MRIKRLPTGSIVYGKLPRGCRLCQQGLKTVIFLTGLCPYNCFYCPLSEYRKQRDVTIINETEVSFPEEYFRKLTGEVLKSGSRGASLTGGDPLVKHRLSVETIRYLKENFGKNFHVHVYTTGLLLGDNRLRELVDAGLDELRIHSPLEKLENILKLAHEYRDKLAIGLEYPSLPGSIETLLKLLELAEKYELEFINLNQLEFTETNSLSLQLHGYKLAKDYRAAEGSKETALELLDHAEKKASNVTIHYCPVIVKDHYQTGLRFYRTANIMATPHQMVTDSGTTLEIIYEELVESQNAPRELYPDNKLHPLLVDYVKKGRIIEKAPSMPSLILEETPIENHPKPKKNT